MTFGAPWAFAGLVALPLLVWFHQRRRRRPPIDVGSLLFFEDERDAHPVRRTTIDLELLLALAAAALLVVAAAGPRVLVRPGGSSVRVVVSGGAPAGQRGYAARVEEALAGIRARLRPSDRLEVVWEPGGGGERVPRPTPGDLLASARAGGAAVRLVVSDREPPEEALGGHWVSVGVAGAVNVGLVGAALEPAGAGARCFAVLRRLGEGPAPRLRLVADGTELVSPPLAFAGTAVSWSAALDAMPRRAALRLETAEGHPWSDDLAADDEVSWTTEPLAVRFEPGVPAPHARLVRRALDASRGPGGWREAGPDALLQITTGAPTPGLPALVLHPLRTGGATLLAAEGPDGLRPHPLVADLSTQGLDLVYDPAALGAPAGPGGEEDLLWRTGGGRAWPVVRREGAAVHFLPDPLAGTRAPADSPLWPLFVDDLLAWADGAAVAGGARRRGLLDAESTRLGTRPVPLDPAVLDAAVPDREPVWRTLRPLALALGALALLLLWGGPALRRRGGRAAAEPSRP